MSNSKDIRDRNVSNGVLILNRTQFGTHVDTFEYTRHLSRSRHVTYVCWDYGHERRTCDGATIVYVSRTGSKPVRYLRFLIACIREARRPYSLGFFQYFPGCSLVKLTGRVPHWIFDIRSGRLSDSAFKTRIYNLMVRTEALLFRNISVISASLAELMGFDRKRVHILPLGADPLSAQQKTFGKGFRLLYVGTLHLRKIDLTLRGLARFIENDAEHRIERYTVIGSGHHGEKDDLNRLIEELDLVNVVDIEGQVPHSDLPSYFDRHNVGVAFIPMTTFFDAQPATKVFEYMSSGMITLATHTTENADAIDETTGILMTDTAEGFMDALRDLHVHSTRFDSRAIRTAGLRYSWSEIVTKNLIPYIERITGNAIDQPQSDAQEV